jgi:hypothetical protein
MEPIQVWIPSLTASPGLPEVQRDRERAYSAWRGEDTESQRRWRNGMVRLLAIPGEHLDRIDIYHIGENGYAFGPGVNHRFPDRRIAGLLEAWLNVNKSDGITIYRAAQDLELGVPRFSAERVEMVTKRFRTSTVGTIPIVEVGREDRSILLHWPPKGHVLPTVSPSQESREHYGEMRTEELDGLTVLASESDPDHKSLAVRLAWPKPLTNLMPVFAGIDEMHQYAKMVAIAEQSSKAPDRALAEARNGAVQWVSEGTSILELAYLMPVYSAEGEDGALWTAEVRSNVEAESLGELLFSEEWKKKAWQPIPITRAWGAIGLFWALLLEELEVYRPFNKCQRCGRIIRGTRGRKFCNPEEDPNCHRARARDRQRKLRAHTEKGSRGSDKR